MASKGQPAAAAGGDQQDKKADDSAPATGSGSIGDATNAALNDARSSLKWIVGAGAAVGAVLVAGISLADFGRIPRSDVWLAAGCAAVAMIGVAALLVLTYFGLTSKGYYSLNEAVRHQKAGDETMADAQSVAVLKRVGMTVELGQRQGLDQLGTKLAELSTTQYDAAFAHANAVAAAKPETDVAPLLVARERATVDVDSVTAIAGRLTALASYYKRRRDLRWIASLIGVSLLVIAAGILGFAVVTRPKPTLTIPAVLLKPVEATLKLSDAGIAKAKALGVTDGCAKADRNVLVVAPIAGGFRVVLMPSEDCVGSIILELGAGDGKLGELK